MLNEPADRRPLSPAQQRVYERLVEHERRTGAPPDLAEFARGLGVHYVSLRQHLEALAAKGYLRFESRGRGRSPLLELPAGATGVPVLGAIPAGPLTSAEALAEAYLPAAVGGGPGAFALRVRGDSMADLIQDGDVVLLEQGRHRRSGEICAVRVDDDEVTLKYLDDLGAGRFALRPHNPAYPTVEVAGNRLAVDGVYRGLLRGSVAAALTQPS